MSTQYISYINSIGNTIYYYPFLVAFPIGLVGNAFSFLIYTRPNLNKTTNTGFLYAWLSLINLVFILYFVLVYQSKTLLGYSVTLPCGLVNYIYRVMFCTVPWMQVIISFDRLIAVVFPHKKKFMSKKWLLYLIMLGILALLVVANMPSLLTFPQTLVRSNVTYVYCSTSKEVTVASNILTVLFRAYIPFILMLVFDVIVFKRLRKSKRRVGVTQIGQQKQPGQISNKEYNFIVSTIIIDLTFVLFYTPAAAYLLITVADTFVDWDRLTSAAIYLFSGCALLLAFLYSNVSFFIFFIINRYFRNEVFTILRINKLFPDLNQTMMETGSTANMNRSVQ